MAEKVKRSKTKQGSTKNNVSGRIVTGVITQSQNVTTQTEILSQNERLQLIPEWSMKGNSKRRPPETRCVSDGH